MSHLTPPRQPADTGQDPAAAEHGVGPADRPATPPEETPEEFLEETPEETALPAATQHAPAEDTPRVTADAVLRPAPAPTVTVLSPAGPDGAPGHGEEEAAAAHPDETSPARPGRSGRRLTYPRVARGVSIGTTVLAAALVLGALLLPNQLDRLTVTAFLRIPAEGILLAGLLLTLPPRPRRVTAVAAGLLLGLLTILKCVDMGFYEVLVRPFDLVLDWILLGAAAEWVRESFGRGGELFAIAAVIVHVIAVLVLTTLAMVRESKRLVRHPPGA
ncbi:sulfatase, partial [Streptomyces sp. NPDC058964]